MRVSVWISFILFLFFSLVNKKEGIIEAETWRDSGRCWCLRRPKRGATSEKISSGDKKRQTDSQRDDDDHQRDRAVVVVVDARRVARHYIFGMRLHEERGFGSVGLPPLVARRPRGHWAHGQALGG
jgi:hypothetical protein